MNKEYKITNQPCTRHVTDLAMKIVSKDVLAPKCVRDGLVKPITMEDEYIIINKTVLDKRMEVLLLAEKKQYEVRKVNRDKYWDSLTLSLTLEMEFISKILAQSTPLTPVVEKSISFCWFESKKPLSHLINIQQDYIKNLKLDI